MSALSVDRLEPRRLLADVLPAAVNGAIVHQTIDAIGAAVTSYQQSVHKDPNYLNQVFGDLGISAVRGAIDTGWEPKNDNNDPNVFNWAGFDDTAIAPVMEFFAQAKARGVKTFLLTVWSPAAWLKTNKSTDNGGQLRPELREEYAESVAAAVVRAKAKWGVDITHVSIMNEGWFTEPYPSAVYTPEQWRDTVKAVSAKFKREGLATQIIGPEDVSSLYRVNKYTQVVAADPVASAAVPIIGTHYLNDDDAQHLADTLAGLNKKLWFSEVGNGSPDFAGALGLARGIDSAFTRADATAWINWQLSLNDTPREALMKGATPNPKYYALKHFAHFIRPGAQRIDVKYYGDLVRVSAYKDPKTGALTIELSNSRPTDVDVNLSLSNLALPASFKQYRTSATENFKQLANVAGGANPTVSLPAGSIVTLYAGAEPVIPKATTAAKAAPQKSIPDIIESDPLRYAAMFGAVDDLKILLATGHDVNAAAPNGWTPLFAAASSPYYWVDWNMQLLLDAGANAQARDTESLTALHVAAMSEIVAYGTAPSISAKRITMLLDAGIDVNARDSNGRTALMYAAELPKVGGDLITVDTSVIETLLARGADPNLKDNFGRTAADFAKAENFTAALALLPAPTPPPPPPIVTGTASIRAYVVNDTNKNGVWNSGELGISGRSVWLDLDNDNVKDSDEPSAVTSSNGVFSFTNLKAGTYFVREVLPAGWKQTSPTSSAPLTIKLTDGQLSSGKYFATAKI